MPWNIHRDYFEESMSLYLGQPEPGKLRQLPEKLRQLAGKMRHYSGFLRQFTGFLRRKAA
tara:strand:- start:373 stop:552 length:180 start_codon:yes stop_codon:yes gene_type:complete